VVVSEGSRGVAGAREGEEDEKSEIRRLFRGRDPVISNGGRMQDPRSLTTEDRAGETTLARLTTAG